MSYQDDALRTEVKDYTEAAGRLTPSLKAEIGCRLAELHDLCSRLDAIKKHVFYGRVLEKDASFEGLGTNGPVNMRLLHGVLGLITEANEAADYVYRDITEDGEYVLDEVGLGKEVGDSQWYSAQLADVCDTTLEKIQEENIAKLRRRYPAKFEEALAQTHDGQ
jgi:NTP pyrophosphatase (non-canonical NTP hydrolase)